MPRYVDCFSVCNQRCAYTPVVEALVDTDGNGTPDFQETIGSAGDVAEQAVVGGI